jgi:TRAP-type C4-dicarboxylate transport system permease small subunit
MTGDDPLARKPPSALARRLETSLGGLAAAALFAMMAVTFFDVLGRYLFHAPIQGAYETVALCMGIAVFAALPVVTAREEHLQIGLFENAMAPGLKRWVAVIIDLISAVVLAVYAWRVGGHGLHLLRTGEVLVSLKISVGPFALFMAAMAAASSLIALLLAAGKLRAIGRGQPA